MTQRLQAEGHRLKEEEGAVKGESGSYVAYHPMDEEKVPSSALWLCE